MHWTIDSDDGQDTQEICRLALNDILGELNYQRKEDHHKGEERVGEPLFTPLADFLVKPQRHLEEGFPLGHCSIQINGSL